MPSGTSLTHWRVFFRERLTPVFYASSSATTAMAQMVSGVLVIKWVAPEELGLWQSVRLAQIYGFLLLLGVNNGLSRELPFFLGKGETQFADHLVGTALFCTTVANAVILGGGITCALIFLGRGPHVLWAILSITFVIITAFYQNVLIVTFRSKDSFRKLTRIQFSEAGLTLATIPIVYCFHYEGLLARVALISGVVVSLMFVFRPINARLQLDPRALRVLLKTGLPIFALDYVKNAACTFDRVILLHLGGVRDVGMYALAVMIFSTLQVLPKSLSSYSYPRMSYKLGQSGDPLALWKYALKFTCLSTALVAGAAFCGWCALPHLVSAFAPKYREGLLAAEIILIAGLFDSATCVADALWSLKSWRLMVAYNLATAAIFAAGPLLGYGLIAPTLEGVAWGVVGGYLCRALLAISLTYYGTHSSAGHSQLSI